MIAVADLPTPAPDTAELRAALKLLAAREVDNARCAISLEVELDRVCGSPERAMRVMSTVDRWRRGDDAALAVFVAPRCSPHRVELRAVPGPGRPVERLASVSTPHRGGRRDLSVVGFLVALAGALIVPAWLSFSIWKGVRP